MSIGVDQYFGKHRGTVLNNVDPEQRGRLLVQVPDVLGLGTSSWAMPCVAGGRHRRSGRTWSRRSVPVSGWSSSSGNPDYPIWTGGSGARPPRCRRWRWPGSPASPNVVLQTRSEHADAERPPGPTGGIMLKSTTGAMIMVNDTESRSPTARAQRSCCPAPRSRSTPGRW